MKKLFSLVLTTLLHHTDLFFYVSFECSMHMYNVHGKHSLLIDCLCLYLSA